MKLLLSKFGAIDTKKGHSHISQLSTILGGSIKAQIEDHYVKLFEDNLGLINMNFVQIRQNRKYCLKTTIFGRSFRVMMRYKQRQPTHAHTDIFEQIRIARKIVFLGLCILWRNQCFTQSKIHKAKLICELQSLKIII